VKLSDARPAIRAAAGSALRRARPAAACLFLLGPGSPQAVEYAFDGNLALGQQYNSNIVLARNPQAVWGTSLDLDAGLSAREPNWQVGGRTRLANSFYAPNSSIDMQNRYVDATALYLTERSRYQLAGNFTDDYLLSSQSDPALGVVLGQLHRNLKSVGPSWTYSLTERARATLGYDYARAEYSGSATQAYPDSDTHAASSQFAYQFTERLTLNGALSYTAFQASQPSAGYRNAIDYVNFSLGLKCAYDPALDLNFSAGGQYTHSQAEYSSFRLIYVPVSLNPPLFRVAAVPTTLRSPAQETTAPLFTLGLSKRFEDASLDLAYSRQISPSINGALLETDRVQLAGRQEFRPGLNGALSLSYIHQSYPNLGGGRLEYSYYQAEASLSYGWSERWSATASYRYYLRRVDSGGDRNQDSNAAFLSLRYEFEPQKF
jgi:hypothetical protein